MPDYHPSNTPSHSKLPDIQQDLNWSLHHNGLDNQEAVVQWKDTPSHNQEVETLQEEDKTQGIYLGQWVQDHLSHLGSTPSYNKLPGSWQGMYQNLLHIESDNQEAAVLIQDIL